MDNSASSTSLIKTLTRLSQRKISETDQSLRFSIFLFDLKRTKSSLNNEDYISALPEEIILNIFKYFTIPELRTCALVSKLWLLLSFSEELWWNVALKSLCIEISFLERILNCPVKTIHFSEVKINRQDKSKVRPFFKTPIFETLQGITMLYTRTDLIFVEEILSLSPHIKTIELLGGSCDRIGGNFFREVVNLWYFEKLHLCFMKIEEISDIVKILKDARKFVNLKHISFVLRSPNTDSFESSELSEKFIENFLTLCPNLEIIILRKQLINDKAFGYILQMNQLKELNIRMNNLSVDVDLLYKENFKKWDNLQKLYIDNMDMSPEMQTTFLYLSPNLKVLDISGFITHSAFEHILNMEKLIELKFSDAELTILHHFESFKKFQNLRILQLSKGVNFTARLLSKLLWRCNNLSELTIFGHEIDEVIFREILEMRDLEKLEFLDIKILAPFITKDSSGNYIKFGKLKFLDLRFDDPKPDPITIENILLSCKNLTRLEIGQCAINDVVWRHILSMTNLECLRLSGLEDNNYVSSSNMENTEKFPKLTKLEVLYAKFENNPGRLDALLPLCSNVCNLYLHYIPLTDSICRSIASMKELKTLHLNFVLNVTDEKIAEILNSCPKLTRKKIRIVKFRRCHN